MIKVSEIRKDFPILAREVNGKQLVYLDNAATSQKPIQVIEAVSEYYKNYNANVHRGIHTLSIEATEKFEEVRAKVAKFVGVNNPSEIIFVRNATEAINLVAYSWGRLNVTAGDEIVLSVAEHHSNFVPWQQLASENGAVFKIIPVDENGELDLEVLRNALTKKTKLVALFHVSNVLGTINPVKEIVKIVHELRTKNSKLSKLSKPLVLIDGAQAVPHMPVNISEIGADFYVFTGHKMLAPTGVGILWGKRELLEALPPFLFGGEMISKVDFDKSTWNELPWKFEAGTPDIAGVIGLGAAIDYLSKMGMENIRNNEKILIQYALKQLTKLPNLSVYGPQNLENRGGPPATPEQDGLRWRAGVISFNISADDGKIIHAHDVAQILDSVGIAIRSGHHCAQPLMKFLGIQSAARVSFYLYNTHAEVDCLISGLKEVLKVFGKGQFRKKQVYYARATV